jgi:hypothetical protein
MNTAQRIVLILGLLLIFGMALYPPWSTTTEFGETTAGYRLVLRPSSKPGGQNVIHIDTARLSSQFIAVIALTAMMYLVLHSSKK